MLLIAQLAIKRKVSKIIEKTPFLTNYRKKLDIFLEPRQGLNAKKAIVLADDIKVLH